MNFFSHWTEQIAPYAEKASPYLSLVLVISFIAFWVLHFKQKKNDKPIEERIDWVKIPHTIVMLVYTFQWAFVPDFQSILGDILVVIFIITALLWLKNHYRTPIAEEEMNEKEESKKSDDKNN